MIKLHDDDGRFVAAYNIPSVYWPLNGPYEVFHFENTYSFEEESEMIAVFNEQEYMIGYCYDNTKRLSNALRNKGIDVKTYCGWVFISNTIPLHHCWAVATDEEGHKTVLDLSCDNYQMHLWFEQREQTDPGWLDHGDPREKVAEWLAYALKNLSHAQRCYPCGVLPPTHLYIGCECDPQTGIQMYRNLVERFVDHQCIRNLNTNGYNPTQWILKQKGLMN